MSGVKRRHTQRLASGQHLLRSPLADELAAAAGIAGGDLVVEIGAGTGRLTAPLAERAGHVIAIEVDPRLARQLRRRFQVDGRVTVVEADGLAAALPQSPFRVVSNLPFAITTPMLRRLLDGPGLPLRSADLVVQRGFAVKRCSPRPCTLLSAGWLPWWQLGVERVLPPDCFQPPPSVESAVLSARRRPRPLVDAAAADDYRLLLRRAFRRDNRPVRVALGLERRRWAAFTRPRGLADDARPTQLDVWDWAALHAHLRPSSASRWRGARA